MHLFTWPDCLVSLPDLSSCLPCHPAYLVILPALSPAYLVILPTLSSCLPCHPSCLVILPALSSFLPCHPAYLVILPALSSCLPCQPVCLVILPALLACLLCFVPNISTCSCPSGSFFQLICLWYLCVQLCGHSPQEWWSLLSVSNSKRCLLFHRRKSFQIKSWKPYF